MGAGTRHTEHSENESWWAKLMCSHLTSQDVPGIVTRVHTLLCHYLPTTDYTKVSQQRLEAPGVHLTPWLPGLAGLLRE